MDVWIRCESKSHPGRFYLFNKTNGERKWCTSDANCIKPGIKESTLTQLSLNNCGKTPAQDRLKRLQSRLNKDLELQKGHKIESKSHPGRFYVFNKTNGEKKWCTGDANYSNPFIKEPTHTQLSLNNCGKTPAQDRLKRLQSRPKEDLELQEGLNIKAKFESPSKRYLQNFEFANRSAMAKNVTTERARKSSALRENATKEVSTKETSREHRAMQKNATKEVSTKETSREHRVIQNETQKTAQNISEDTQNYAEVASSYSASSPPSPKPSTSRFIGKIKRICVSAKNRIQSALSLKRPLFKTPKNDTIPIKHAKEALQELLKEEEQKLEQKEDDNIVVPLSASSQNATNKIVTVINTPKSNLRNRPREKKNIANARLQRLCVTLQQQNNLNHNLTNKLNVKEIPNTNCSNNAINDVKTNKVNDWAACEAMDWQPSEEQLEQQNKANNNDSNSTKENAKLDPSESEALLMGDLYDKINDNLMRKAAEKETHLVDKWRKEFYYFIIDTNVLLSYLTFVEDLTKMKLCGTQGSILYIPYRVLQELDSLKMRRGPNHEATKTLAVRANKYLNTKFESKSLHVEAQSAMEEIEHLIKVEKNDDSIINCCLQVQRNVKNVMLLSEDINLRNKAICNKISVTTKSDLTCRK